MLDSSKYHDATYADGPDDITFEELQQALKTMAGTIVTPVDALVRFHHGTAHFPDDYEIDGVMVTALLKLSGASATDIRTLFRELAESPRDQDAPAADTTTTLVSTGADPSASAGLLTSLASSPADSTSRGLGAQVAKATARDTEHLCGPSPIPHRDVPGAQVPMEDTICRPLLHPHRVEDRTARLPNAALEKSMRSQVGKNHSKKSMETACFLCRALESYAFTYGPLS